MIFIGGQNNQAAASDVYVGTSDTTGRDCYLVTESIYWSNSSECDARLKMVNSYDDVMTLQYHFIMMHHWAVFENSQGFKGRVNDEVPIEKAMWDYILDYSAKHNIRYKK